MAELDEKLSDRLSALVAAPPPGLDEVTARARTIRRRRRAERIAGAFVALAIVGVVAGSMTGGSERQPVVSGGEESTTTTTSPEGSALTVTPAAAAPGDTVTVSGELDGEGDVFLSIEDGAHRWPLVGVEPSTTGRFSVEVEIPSVVVFFGSSPEARLIEPGPHVLEAVRFDPEGPGEGDLAPGHRASTDFEVTASPAPATCAESAPFSAVYLPDDWDPQLIPGSGSGDDLVCFGHWMGPDKSRRMTVMLASDAEHLRDGTGSAETFPDGSPLGEHRVLTYEADDGYVAFFEWEGEIGARLPLAIVGIGVTREEIARTADGLAPHPDVSVRERRIWRVFEDLEFEPSFGGCNAPRGPSVAWTSVVWQDVRPVALIATARGTDPSARAGEGCQEPMLRVDCGPDSLLLAGDGQEVGVRTLREVASQAAEDLGCEPRGESIIDSQIAAIEERCAAGDALVVDLDGDGLPERVYHRALHDDFGEVVEARFGFCTSNGSLEDIPGVGDAQTLRLTDVDLDGRPEVLFGGTSPDGGDDRLAVWNGQELVLAQRDIGPLELRHGRRSLGSAPPPGSEPIHHLVGYGCGAPGALAGGAQIATWSLTADDGLVDGPGGSQPRTSGEEVHLYVMTFRVDAGSVEQVEEFGEHFSTVGEALARVAELGIDDRCRRYITAPGDCPGGQPLRPDPSLPPAVEATRLALGAAAAGCDVDALIELASHPRFESSFGGPVPPPDVFAPQGVVDVELLRLILDLLDSPSGLSERNPDDERPELWIWPAGFGLDPEERTASDTDELERLFPGSIADDGFYYGPRLGIRANGTWSFVIRG